MDNKSETDDSKSLTISTVNEAEVEETSFFTSTPKSDKSCEECKNNTECVDCIVRQVLGTRKLFF